MLDFFGCFEIEVCFGETAVVLVPFLAMSGFGLDIKYIELMTMATIA